MNRSEAGRLGGKSTFSRYGKAHMAEIGCKGAAKFWELYTIQPVQLSKFAIVRKSDHAIIRIINGNLFLDTREERKIKNEITG